MYPKSVPCPVFFEKEGKVLNDACNHARDTLNRESKLDDTGSQVCRFFVTYVRDISPLSTSEISLLCPLPLRSGAAAGMAVLHAHSHRPSTFPRAAGVSFLMHLSEDVPPHPSASAGQSPRSFHGQPRPLTGFPPALPIGSPLFPLTI